jgi:hypothetical protein
MSEILAAVVFVVAPLLMASATRVIGTGPIECRERVGGLLRFYYREAT